MSLLLLLSLALSNPTPTAPDLPEEPLVTGKIVHFTTTIIGEERPLWIRVPQGTNPGGRLDLVVVLDGETHWRHVSGIVDFLSHRYVDRMPKAVVIGIPNTNRIRDTTPTPTAQWPQGGGARDFVRFLAEELLPWAEESWNLSRRRTLVGHSGSALAAMYALLDVPDAFQHIVAVDPSLGWDEGVFFDDAQAEWNLRRTLELRLLVSTYRDKEVIRELQGLLRRSAPGGLDWSVDNFQGETHNSMVHRAVYDGLLQVYGTEAQEHDGESRALGDELRER